MRIIRAASLIVVAGLILIAGAVAVIAIFGDRLLAAAIEKTGPALLGREVHVGRVAIDWGRHATVRATDLTLADATWSANPAMLRIRRAELTLDLLDLLRLRLSPVAVGLQQPRLHLARNAQGHWNLPQMEGGSTSGGGVRSSLLTLRWVKIEGGELIVDDLASPGVEAEFTALSASLTPSVEGVEFRGTVNHDGSKPIEFSGRTGPPAALPGRDDSPFPVRLTAGPETARISAAGHIARPLDLDGVDLHMQAQGENLAPLLAAFVGTATDTPPFNFSAQLTETERGWSLKDVTARMGESEMRGEAALLLDRQAKPQLSVSLVAPQFLPSDFRWLTSLGREHEDSPSQMSDVRLPTAWLDRADAQGTLQVERFGGMANSPATLRLDFKLDEGRLHIEPIQLELAHGIVEGTSTIDAGDGASPRVMLHAEAKGMQLGPLLATFGTDELTGTLETALVDLRGQGTTLREIMAGLDGALRFRMTDGSIGLSNLSQMSMGLVETLGVALGGQGGSVSTPLTCAIGDLAVRHGVARTERLVMVIPRIVIVGEGSMRLGDAMVRLTLTPRPLDEALLRVVVPVVISGDLASPDVSKHPELRVGAQAEVVPDPCNRAADQR